MTVPLSKEAPAQKRTRRPGLRARVRKAGIGQVVYVAKRVRLKYVVSFLEEGRERVKGFGSREEASAWRQARIDAETALPDGVLPHTFAEAAEHYLQSRNGQRIGNAGLLELHVLPVFGALQLHEIEQATINAFHQRIWKAEYQHAHRDRIIAIFREVMEGAKARGWLSEDYLVPSPRVKHDMTPARRAWARKAARRMPSLAVVDLLLAESTGFLRTVLHLCLLAGMRIGEILALQWGDVKFKEKRIYVGASVSDLDRHGRKTCSLDPVFHEHGDEDPNKRHRRPPKTSNGYRYIRITPLLHDILMEVKPTNPKPGDRVVFGPGQKQLTQGAVYLHYLRLQAELGLAQEHKVRRGGRMTRIFEGGFTMHALRHAAVAMMIFSGVKIEQIRRVLGHSHQSITLDIYGYLIKLHEEGQQTWPSVDGDRLDARSQPFSNTTPVAGVSEQVIGGRVHRLIDLSNLNKTITGAQTGQEPPAPTPAN